MATQDKLPAQVSELRENVGEDGHTRKDSVTNAITKGQGLSGYETLTVWETIKAFKMNALICFLASVSAATDGYQIALIGNLVANPGFIEQFGTVLNSKGEISMASSVLSTFNALASVGQIVGMVTLPFLSDRFGRKAAMFWYWYVKHDRHAHQVLLAMSIVIECVAKNWQTWLIAKILGGIGVGCMQSTLPAYIAEIAPTRVRGASLMCYSVWWMVGQFFAPVALQVMAEDDPKDYLTVVYSQWGHIGLMFLIYLWLPESPIWCIGRGQTERAKKMIRFIYRGADIDVEHQYNLMVLVLEHERTELAGRNDKWWAIFKGIDGWRTIVACWTLVTQQFIGLGVFLSFASYFFLQAGIDDPFKVVCITSGINITATIAFMYVADTWGRRYLACAGTTLCWVCNVVIGIIGVTPQTGATNIVFVVFACFWNIGLMANASTGWGFIGEISSQRLRPYTAGFAAASSCVIGVIMSVLIPSMINETDWNWGLKTCWFFAGVGAPFTIGMWFIIPETAGRTHAELDELFERKIRPWQFSKTVTATGQLLESEKQEST
ncbi:general substrate transporter [Lophiostoma macrostomum CBS 122681]|uniref:General substrate transporter n=1 Tax=Lophiostoma macrostomum CBS 122681 TaxID=1314788 RepID=A0A6A6SUS2_9PLEO|nr:general substrate transporter [Lophiostoma macrostomum CBS 122681]